MTREEAIYEIKQLAVLSTKRNIDRITEALEMAIEALRKTENSSEKPNNCENCKHHFGKDYYDIECEAKAFGNECKFEPKDKPQTERSNDAE